MSDSTLNLGSSPKAAPESIAPEPHWKIDEVYRDLHFEPIPPIGLFLKRLMDLLIALPALLFVIPIAAIVAAAIKLDSSGPVLYCSRRVGKGGRTFTCYKFRSMVANADDSKEYLRQHNQRHGPTFKIKDDPRLTRL